MRQRKGIAFKKHFSARATRPRGLPSFARRSKNTTKAVASLVFSTPPLSTVKSCDNFVGDARRKKHATRPVKRRAVAIGASFYIARREKRTSFFNRDIAHHRVVYYVSLRGKNEGDLGPCVRLRAFLEEKIFPQIINFYGLWVFFLKAAQIVKKRKTHRP